MNVFSLNTWLLILKSLVFCGGLLLAPQASAVILNNLHKMTVSYFFLVQLSFLSLLLLTEKNCNWAFIILRDCLLPIYYLKASSSGKCFSRSPMHLSVCCLIGQCHNPPSSQSTACSPLDFSHNHC